MLPRPTLAFSALPLTTSGAATVAKQAHDVGDSSNLLECWLGRHNLPLAEKVLYIPATNDAKTDSCLIPPFDVAHLLQTNEYITLRRQGACFPGAGLPLAEFAEWIAEGGSAVIPVTMQPEYQPLQDALMSCFVAQQQQQQQQQNVKSVNMNIYHSGPNGVALLPHTDSYDVLVVHLEGTKTWEIVENGIRTRLTLEPGDVLYIPANVIHSAQADTLQGSTHLTIGLLNKWTAAETLLYAKYINEKQEKGSHKHHQDEQEEMTALNWIYS